jgi:hypothetical protein
MEWEKEKQKEGNYRIIAIAGNYGNFDFWGF